MVGLALQFSFNLGIGLLLVPLLLVVVAANAAAGDCGAASFGVQWAHWGGFLLSTPAQDYTLSATMPKDYDVGEHLGGFFLFQDGAARGGIVAFAAAIAATIAAAFAVAAAAAVHMLYVYI